MEPKIEPWIKEFWEESDRRGVIPEIMNLIDGRLTGEMLLQNRVRLAKIIRQVLNEKLPELAESYRKHAPSSPAAPTPHMNAAEFYREVWIKENGSDPRGDWPIRMAEAYAASETARADRAEREKESWRISYETHWKALQEATAEIQRKDVALKTLLRDVKDAEPWMDDTDSTSGTIRECLRRSIVKAEGALAPIPAAPEVAPSPCCANPKMVVKGTCDLEDPYEKHVVNDLCRNPRPTHNVCLNCGKEEKI